MRSSCNARRRRRPLRASASDLGIIDTTLSNWLEAAGVPVRGQWRPRAQAPPGDETPEQELARPRARVRDLEDCERKLNIERDILRAAAKYFVREGELVSGFQFVAGHQATYEVKRLCEVIEVSRSSFYAWGAAAPARAARAQSGADLAARIQGRTPEGQGLRGAADHR